MSPADAAGTDLVALCAELVDVPSVSHEERAIANFVEGWLRALPGGTLEVRRIGDNVCARTSFGLGQRMICAGHLDTVPPNGNERAVLDGEILRGLGTSDMKGGLAVFLALARAVDATADPSRLATDLTFVFYVCEEVDRRFSGLPQIEQVDPDLLDADVAVLGEPTSSAVEAGCQGVLRVAVDLVGERAHTARPWMGVNAIHRLGRVLARVDDFEPRQPVLDGCQYREALQAVRVEGGVAANVVPDHARVVLNHRFAPDRDAEEAFAAVRAVVAPAIDESMGDRLTLEDVAAPAVPGLGHPLLAALVAASGAEPRAKLGWTDVSYFSSRGVPAANFGPGDPTLAHTAGELVTRTELERAFATLAGVVGLA